MTIPSGHSILFRILEFRLCRRNFAISMEWIREILPMASLAHLPGSPSFLEGFLNLRGSALPVLRLERVFGYEDLIPGLDTLILVIKAPDNPFGVMVDQVMGIRTIPDSELAAIGTGHSLNDCVEAAIGHGDHAVQLLSPDRILHRLEQERVSGLRDREQSRLHALATSPFDAAPGRSSAPREADA